MYRTLIFSALVAVALGGKSPHYDKILEIERSSSPGARYSTDVLEDAKLDAIGLLEKYGYPAERHNVITSDGYILEMHRIPHGKGLDPNVVRTPLIIMHGLPSSSADFLVLGTGRALAYVLSDAGYDVWLGNARGNYYSRRHQTLDPDNDIEFWQFSWDQIGNFDLPAMIDHVLATTGQNKLHYIGHSQGGTTFLVMASLRPEYNDKIISFQGLAPASFFNHHENPFTIFFAPFSKIIEVTAHFFGFGELLGNRAPISWLAANFCADHSIYQDLCISLAINGEKVEYYNTTLLPLFLGHAPSGAALRQLRHFGQSINRKTFRRYDYGSSIANIIYYGRAVPPDYDLSLITAPIYIHYTMRDTLVNYQDIYLLANSVSNLRGVYRAQRTSFGHVDYMWGNDAKEQVYDPVITTLKLAENLN